MAVTSAKWLEAQRAVIGSLMIDQACAGEVFQTATAAMFSDQNMRKIFEAVRDLWGAGKVFDPVTVLAKAGDDQKDLIWKCMEMTPTAAHAGAYARIVRTEARLAALQVEALAISTAETMEDAEKAYANLGPLFEDTEDLEDYSLTEMIGMYLDRMNDQTPPDYLHFGIERLDAALAVTPGMFVILGADSSTGKTALALQFAVHIAKAGKRVGFFSLETPQEPLQNRLMAERQLAGIPVPSSQHKKLTDEDFRRAAEIGMASGDIPLRVIRKATTMTQIRARTIQRQFEVIFVDYLQLIDCPGRDRYETVTQISMGMHRMAQELGVTVIGLSQITQGEKGKKAKLTVDDLRESRQLKQDADIVLLMSKSTEKNDPPEARVLEIAKNKDGRRAKVRLNFDPKLMTFDPLLTMEDIRSDGRLVKQQAVINQKREDKKKQEAEHIPEDANGGKMVELSGDGEDLPF